MATHDWQLFPEHLSVGTRGGPSYRTTVVRSDSGFEVRRSQATKPSTEVLAEWFRLTSGTQTYDGASRLVFDVTKDLQRPENYAEILSFFHTVRGRGYAFRFWDPTDWSTSPAHAEPPNVFNPAHYSPIHLQVGTERTYQLKKLYNWSGEAGSGGIFARKITRPMRLTVDTKAQLAVIATFGGAAAVPGKPILFGNIDIHCEWDTGIIRLDSKIPTFAPGTLIFALFTFHVPCRFGTDSLDAFQQPEIDRNRLDRLSIVEISPDKDRGDCERLFGGWSVVDYKSSALYASSQAHKIDLNNGIFQQYDDVVAGDHLLLPDPTSGIGAFVSNPTGYINMPTGGPWVRIYNNSDEATGGTLDVMQQTQSLYDEATQQIVAQDPLKVAALRAGIPPQGTAEIYLAQRSKNAANPDGELSLWTAR